MNTQIQHTNAGDSAAALENNFQLIWLNLKDCSAKKWTLVLKIPLALPKMTGLLKIACKSLNMLYYNQILDSIFLSTCFHSAILP